LFANIMSSPRSFSLWGGPNFLVLVVHRVVTAKLAARKSDGLVLLVENARTGPLRARMTRPALVIRWILNGAGSGSPVGFLAAMCATSQSLGTLY